MVKVGHDLYVSVTSFVRDREHRTSCIVGSDLDFCIQHLKFNIQYSTFKVHYSHQVCRRKLSSLQLTSRPLAQLVMIRTPSSVLHSKMILLVERHRSPTWHSLRAKEDPWLSAVSRKMSSMRVHEHNVNYIATCQEYDSTEPGPCLALLGL